MSEKGADTWKSFKTGFARAKHRVLAKVGAAETTVDTKIQVESEKLFTLFKLMKRLNKNVEKYQEIIKNISILQNEMAHDILSFDEKDPNNLAYQESMRELERQRVVMEEFIETYYHDPLRQYLAQFREIRERLEELDLRRLDMDRYFRDYSIKANKGKDATSLAKTESKHQKTKEGYQTLSDELMRDMPMLYNDRQTVFDPAFAALINRSAEFFNGTHAAYGRSLHSVQSINEYDVINHPWVITATELSSISTNVRSSAVFTTKIDSNYSPPTSRSRASTIATTTPTNNSANNNEHNAYGDHYHEAPPPVTLNKYEQPSAPYQPQPTYTTTTTTTSYTQSYSPPASQQHQYQSPPPQQQMHNLNLNGANNHTANLSKSPSPKFSPQTTQQPSGMTVIKPAPGSSTYGTVAFSGSNPGGAGSTGGAPRANPNAGRALPKPAGIVPPSKALPTAEAIYDFAGQDQTELSFKKGDIISLHSTTGDWLDGELHGRKGLIPFNYDKHTIVLIQPEYKKASRTFIDYESVDAALEGICFMFEQRLKQMRPNQKNITYDVQSLFKYLDEIPDLSCLIYTPSINAYTPYNKEWIKNKIVILLQKMAR
ncbi:hypothetical protein PPL_02725 [Heterostelium album PN500]|uniref:Uncharacterized protein n=1 Tax=Heterostelium pallidum (strain ATCC 26659 / Pp 5 / PN500) TaxID=670386 RepID=D3B2W1_HETP5|nr:hypothetical protein PPL_02725 [Heterostelium album PN500]EFA83659.1 hypothetical protein PPL_02725 [Heterostelium album PN500]|eukprot:XP_020435776.1 hypothetical protein PPL_02725 [Heterostelium album PN500]